MRRRLITTVIIVAIPVLVGSILLINQSSHQDDWKKKTTPLPKETRILLCTSFGLPLDNPLCKDNKAIYALDFMAIIRDTFRPYEAYKIKSSEAATYDEVEKKIGVFRYKCEPAATTGNGLTFFSCSYDLRGDRAFVMTFLYTYPEKAVMHIMSTSRFDDY